MGGVGLSGLAWRGVGCEVETGGAFGATTCGELCMSGACGLPVMSGMIEVLSRAVLLWLCSTVSLADSTRCCVCGTFCCGCVGMKIGFGGGAGAGRSESVILFSLGGFGTTNFGGGMKRVIARIPPMRRTCASSDKAMKRVTHFRVLSSGSRNGAGMVEIIGRYLKQD